MGNVTITAYDSVYNVSCERCNLTNCITSVEEGTKVVVLYQPAFVMIPVNITGPWYDEKSLQVWKEVNIALACTKRFVGLLIAGITALITLVALATAAAVALTQTIQTAHYVNDL